jgi:molybdate transport system substrate-binding protein
MAIGLLCVWSMHATAQVAPLRVSASNGVKAAIEALLPDIESQLSRPIGVQFGTSASIAVSIATGDPFDVAILTTDGLDALVKAGTVVAGSRVTIGRSGIGVGVRAGAPRPDITTPDSLKRTLLAVRSITYAEDGASRVHITRMLDVLGIADAVKAKTILEQGSVRATGRVAKGEADLVITLVSEIRPIAGIELLGTLPAAFQSYITFAAGISSKAESPDAARTFVAFLSGPAAARTLAAKGIERP